MANSKAAKAQAAKADAKAVDTQSPTALGVVAGEAVPSDTQVTGGSAAWAVQMLTEGHRVHRTGWDDGRVHDPKHMGHGLGMTLADMHSNDWAII